MKVQILRKNDFSEIFFEYKPELIALIKSIQGAKYHSIPVKKWTIPSTEIENLTSKFKVLNVEIEYKFQNNELTDSSPKLSQIIEISIENNQCLVKLPVPKKIFSDLFNVPKTSTKTHWIIDSSNFFSLYKSCSQNNVKLNLI